MTIIHVPGADIPPDGRNPMTESVSGYRPEAWDAIQWLKPMLEPVAAITLAPEWIMREAEAHLAIIRLYENADRQHGRYGGPEVIDALADVIEAIAYIYSPISNSLPKNNLIQFEPAAQPRTQSSQP